MPRTKVKNPEDKVITNIKRPKKFKPVILWAVIDNANPDFPISFTASKEDAYIALDQYLYLKHYAHFRLWCPVHGYKVDHAKAWLAYSRSIIELEYNGEPLYSVAQVNYDPNVIASLLRSVNNCIPMGCPFDTNEELADFSAYLAAKEERVEKGTEEFTPMEEALRLLMDDLAQEECGSCPHKEECLASDAEPEDRLCSSSHKHEEGDESDA